MGLWNGTTINTTAAAQMFNQLWNYAAIAMVRKQNGLLYAIMDKSWNDTQTPGGGRQWNRSQKITGNKIEIKLRGKLDSTTKVADGSSELATVTPAFASDEYGAVTWDLTHYTLTKGVPSSQWMRIKGDEAKTKSFIGEVFEGIMLSYENDWGTDINANSSTAPGRTQMGNWVQAVSDGVSSGESGFATYGLDRSDSANADYRGNVTVSTGQLTLGKVKTLKNTIRAAGGQPSLLVSGTTVYTSFETLIEGFAHVTYDETWSKFGGEYVRYSNMTSVQDNRAPASMMGMLTPESWLWVMSQSGFDDTAFIKDPSRVAARVVPTEAWAGLFCTTPSYNGKLTGITS